MTRRGHVAVFAAGIVVAAWMLFGGQEGRLSAQTKPERPAPSYQYVGVEQTIARIDTATGRIEVLGKRGEPKASLLMPGARPWEWREVPVETPRHREPEKVGPDPEETAPAPDAMAPPR